MALYRALLRVLPVGFRARHAAEMESVFADMLREARAAGIAAEARLWLVTVWDVVRRGAAERRRARDEEGRTMGAWLDGVGQDVRQTVRSLRAAPGFAATATLTLALGIGAVTAVYSVVNGVLLKPLPYPDPDRLVAIYNQYPTLGTERGAQSPGDLADYQDQADRMRGYASVSTFPQTIVEDGVPRRATVALVSPGFLELLGVSAALGRDIAAEDDHDVVILSHAYWRHRYGADPDVLGVTIPFAGVSKTVIGVLPEDFRLVVPAGFSMPPAPELWTPIPAQGWGRDSRDRTAHWMHVVARLEPGVTLAQAQEQMDAVAAWQRENVPRRGEREARIAVVPLHDEVVREVRPALLILLGAAALVVLIACANVANLLLVRAQGRQAEIEVRMALGGGRVRLLRQLLTEGCVLGALGAVLGLGVAVLGADLILGLDPGSLPRVDDIGLDLGVLGFVAVLTVGVAVLFSVAPALYGTRTTGARTLRGGARSGPGGAEAKLSAALIVGEIAISLVLLTGGGLLMRSFGALVDVDPGFRTEGLLTFQAPLPTSAFQVPRPAGNTGPPHFHHVRKPYYDELHRVFSEIPGVRSAGAIFPAPLSGSLSGSTYATAETQGAEEAQLASSQLVTPEYFETVGIPFLEGRTFRPEEAGDRLVIDRTMAERLWPGASALGRRIEIGWWSGAVWGEVIGVVENVRSQSLSEPNPPTVYRRGTVYAYGALTWALRVEGDPASYADAVRAAVLGVEAEAPVIELRPMGEYVREQTATTRFILALVLTFAGVALGLAAVGLYGVVSYAVGRRAREFGVRTAFGARGPQIVGLVLGRGLALTGGGVAVGLVAAWSLRDVIEPFLFGVDATDARTTAVIVVVLSAAALAACAGPAARATRVDPVVSLRAE